MDVVFVLLVIVAFVYTVRITNNSFFWLDDWGLMKQGRSLSGLFDQHNGHLSVLIVSEYRLLPQLFGFNYAPVRVVGFASLFAVPLAYYLTTRRQFGAVLAALLALPLVWYGRYVSLNPNELNHNCALLGGVVCAAALNRGRRADWVLAAALVFSFLSAGDAVAVAAACLVHCACTRSPLRRWIAVLIPSLLWLAWWLIYVGGTPGVVTLSTSQKIRLARDIAFTPFQGFAMDNTVLAVVLLVGFVGLAIWTLTKGLNAGANFVAWSAALVVFVALLVTSRGGLATAEAFRYRFAALVFVLLAVVPRRPIVWPARFPITTDKRWLFAGAAVVLLLGAARGLAVRSDLQDAARVINGFGNTTKAEILTVELGPSVVPDDHPTNLTLGLWSAATLRTLLSKYDDPLNVTRSTIDQKSFDLGLIKVGPAPVQTTTCKKLTAPYKYQSVGFGSQYFWSPDSSYAVDVRRFGQQWVHVVNGHAGTALRVTLPSMGSTQPYEVRAIGACRVSPGRPLVPRRRGNGTGSRSVPRVVGRRGRPRRRAVAAVTAGTPVFVLGGAQTDFSRGWSRERVDATDIEVGHVANFGAFEAHEHDNPVVAGRLRRHDCSQMTDGGAAVILASAEYASEWAASHCIDLEAVPRILGWGHSTARMGFADKLRDEGPYVFAHVRSAIS